MVKLDEGSKRMLNVKVKWIFVLKTNNDWAASQSHMALKAGCCVLAFPFGRVSCFAYHENKRLKSTVDCSDNISSLFMVALGADKRLKSTVDCSDNISSLFMVALGAGADNRPEVSRYSTDEKYSNIFWFRRTYKQLMQWFLMCLKIHGLYSGVVLWYFGVYYAATLPDQASWTGSRGSSMNPVSKLLLRKNFSPRRRPRLRPRATPEALPEANF
ncbi:hypothetical protein T4A_12576 [Trichinella pseudospiralis]|uniref:Uncharacterized protein n=1 Tax=Trichinella pseudospiralis TaxID=6337 RepID=A0A0V1EB62_TRIPS|nr:hypothetical protein T4A_12576 [Trichinella pseudospiralis]